MIINSALLNHQGIDLRIRKAILEKVYLLTRGEPPSRDPNPQKIVRVLFTYLPSLK